MSETRLALGLGGVLLAPVLMVAALFLAPGDGEARAAEPEALDPYVEGQVELGVELDTGTSSEPEARLEPGEETELELPPESDQPSTAWLGGPPLASPVR